MKLLLSFLLFVFSSIAIAADPTLRITAPVSTLKAGDNTVVTFEFSEAVTGFTLSDVNIKGAGQFLTALTGSGTTYQVTFQKLTNANVASLVVDNNAASPAGHGETIGFNTNPVIYVKQGNIFTNKLVPAVPQPECAKVGEILVDSANNPTTAAVENYYIYVPSSRRNYVAQQIRQGCLVRFVNGQKFVKSVAPKSYELANVHGGHNHSTLMPKITQQYIQPLSGTTKPRVQPYNLDDCNPDGSGFWSCGIDGDFRAGNIASKVDFDDPIVYPNVKGAAHAHTFYGNNGVNYQTNSANLQKQCVSTFAGGTVNCTGYWMPSMVDTGSNTVIIPNGILIYYKTLEPAHVGLVEALPQGLKLIAGNPAATSAATQTDRIDYSCFLRAGGTTLDTKTIPNCDGTTHYAMRVNVNFPNCIADDGAGNMVLDSANHRSHAIPHDFVGTYGANGCPSAYPHRIPNITQVADFDISVGQNTSTWRVSSDNYSASLPGGASVHADWWGGWKVYWANRLRDQCNNKLIGCRFNYIGLNDGVPIASITTVGNVATITTAVPHLLKVSLGNGDYPEFLGNNAGTKLRGRISGVTGTSAASYNFDVAKVTNTYAPTGFTSIAPIGTQNLKILNATQIEYTLNSTPASTVVNVTNAKLQWGEYLCGLTESCGKNQAYSDYYYGNKQ